MAEKEERILIDILPPASGFGSCGGFYTEGVGEYFCCWNGEKEPITEEICNNCPHDKSMSRQGAIERMKNADIKKHWECQKEGRRPTDDEMYGAMLDALLEGK